MKEMAGLRATLGVWQLQEPQQSGRQKDERRGRKKRSFLSASEDRKCEELCNVSTRDGVPLMPS